MQQKKEAEKKTEFYLNESTLNYESVKNFGNEQYEHNRYSGYLQNLEKQNLIVQKSLSQLNQG